MKTKINLPKINILKVYSFLTNNKKIDYMAMNENSAEPQNFLNVEKPLDANYFIGSLKILQTKIGQLIKNMKNQKGTLFNFQSTYPFTTKFSK